MGNEQEPDTDINYIPPTPDFNEIFETLYTRGLIKGSISSKDQKRIKHLIRYLIFDNKVQL